VGSSGGLDTHSDEFLQPGLEFIDTEGLSDGNGLNDDTGDKGGKSGEGLFTGTSDSDQKGVTGGLVEDSADSGDVFHGLIEKNEVHSGHEFVVFVKFVFQDFLQSGHRFDRKVVLVRSVMEGDEVGEDVGFGEGVVFSIFVLEDLVTLGEVFSEFVDIFLIDESIFEDSLAFMDPKFDHLAGVTFVGSRSGVHDTFDDFRDFSQVELVMELLGRRREVGVLNDLAIDEAGGFDELFS
jgi:hypothetical protein